MQSSADAPNLTPLLDVVLQLIMFFMITVNFVRVEHFNDDISLPTVQAAVPLERTAEAFVFLNLNADGKLVGKTEKLDSEARLKAFLQRRREEMRADAAEKGNFDLKVTVVLRADENAKYRDVYKVLDACSRAGYYSWQMRVMTKGK